MQTSRLEVCMQLFTVCYLQSANRHATHHNHLLTYFLTTKVSDSRPHQLPLSELTNLLVMQQDFIPYCTSEFIPYCTSEKF